MELNEYQKRSRETAVYTGSEVPMKINGLTYSVLGLGGEAGELLNKLKKAYRSRVDPDPQVLADELGDVLWYASSVAWELGWTLEEVAQFNLDKLAKRKAEKQLHVVGERA